ncbi:MAG TPA: hypothetical protein VD905_06205 [Flavobacteriales bacterium]|nr:hypothetical protein [Flavobacteriales bacterium]
MLDKEAVRQQEAGFEPAGKSYVKRFLIVLFSISFLQTFSQQFINLKDAGTVTCIAYWVKKDAVVYHVAETRDMFKGGKDSPYKSTKMQYDINLKVIDSTEKTYTVDLTYSNFYCDATESDRDFELLKLFGKLHVKYSTTELGEYIRIINKQELAGTLGPLIDKLRGELAPKIKKEDEKENFNQAFDNMKLFFTDTSNVEGLFAEDIFAIHAFYGWELKLNKEEKVAVEYAALANLKLSGNGKLILTEINKNKGECKIQLAQQPEKDALTEYARKVLVTMLGDFSKKAKKDFASLKLGANTKLKYVMDLSTGWFSKIAVTSNSTVSVGDESVRSVSKLTMTML